MTKKKTDPIAEKIASAISLILVIAVVGFLAREGLRREEPAAFDAIVVSVADRDGFFYLTASVSNQGRESAEQIRIIAWLGDGEALIEESEATIDRLPGRSRREVGFVFRNDPRQHHVTIEIEGYQKP